MIWRRVLVPGSVRLSKLHDMLQAAMGWTDSHLHAFRDQGRFVYEYDFGDSWSHDVVIEDFRGNRSG